MQNRGLFIAEYKSVFIWVKIRNLSVLITHIFERRSHCTISFVLILLIVIFLIRIQVLLHNSIWRCLSNKHVYVLIKFVHRLFKTFLTCFLLLFFFIFKLFDTLLYWRLILNDLLRNHSEPLNKSLYILEKHLLCFSCCLIWNSNSWDLHYWTSFLDIIIYLT